MTTRAPVHSHIRLAEFTRPGADRLRVCHVSMTLLTGGLERLLVEIGRHCDRDEFDLSFVALDQVGPPAEELHQLGWPVQSLLDGASRGKLARVRALANHFREARIDVVHTHNTLAHFYATLAAKCAGVRAAINTQHGRGCGASWKAKWQFRLANLGTNRIVGVSEDATRLCQQDDRWSAGRMQPIWNGIDLGRFQFRGPAEAPVAISVSRLSPEKDLGTLLRATALVVRDVPEFRLQIIGDGRERAALESLSQELQLTRHVEFLGERQDIPQLLSRAGFFVSSSLSEGISLTLLEAMAVGLPIVTTNVGGNPEVVDDGHTGWLVPSGDPQALAASLLKMLDDRESWAVMGELGRQRVERCFNVKQMVRQYEDLYREVLDEQEERQ